MTVLASRSGDAGADINGPAAAGATSAADASGLSVEGLRSHFFTARGVVKAVDGVSFSVRPGQTLGLVGESGCGKSITALSIMRLLVSPGRSVAGRVVLDGRNLLELDERDMADIRGNGIAMIFQEPMTALNPVLTVGDQVIESLRRHLGMTRKSARARVLDLFEKVQIPSPRQRIEDYPHQLSGGMRQRVMIAMALSCGPTVLIADEPTTALDVTIQAQILDLLRTLQDSDRMAIMLITHDLGVIAEVADHVAVMNSGKIVEQAPVDELFAAPRHPYTRHLLSCVPSPATLRNQPRRTPPNDEILYEVRNLTKHFPGRHGVVHAVDDISFSIRRGETLGLVGESGCGKTTTGRLLLRLVEATSGELTFAGRNVRNMTGRELQRLRTDVQIIFQDPYASLDPRLPVGDIIAEGLYNNGMRRSGARTSQVGDMLDRVGLARASVGRYPHEFSGGERQRIGIARALVLRPKFIVADEPVSALDVSIQSQILALLKELQDDFGLTYLFISHNLHVVEQVSDRVGVMYLGKLVELAPAAELYRGPRHPYTQALLSAIPLASPRPRRERIVLTGDPPSAVDPPSACRFHPRCPIAQPICTSVAPNLEAAGHRDHLAACHFAESTAKELGQRVAVLP